jgi:hypothetical protein
MGPRSSSTPAIIMSTRIKSLLLFSCLILSTPSSRLGSSARLSHQVEIWRIMPGWSNSRLQIRVCVAFSDAFSALSSMSALVGSDHSVS